MGDRLRPVGPQVRSALHDGVEDAHLSPVRLVLLDELDVARRVLVAVVRRLVLKDDVQGDRKGYPGRNGGIVRAISSSE